MADVANHLDKWREQTRSNNVVVKNDSSPETLPWYPGLFGVFFLLQPGKKKTSTDNRNPTAWRHRRLTRVNSFFVTTVEQHCTYSCDPHRQYHTHAAGACHIVITHNAQPLHAASASPPPYLHHPLYSRYFKGPKGSRKVKGAAFLG